MQFFGIAFIVTTTLILFFKKEKKHLDHYESYEDKLTLKETYKIVWRILNLKSIKKLMFILVTCKIAFALYSMAYLKLIEKGVPKEKLGLLAIPLTPIQVGLPILASRLTNGPKPLSYFIQAYPYRYFYLVK
jgi:PAT family acetyl-CoA transporter-like MFS transporter 1